VGLVAVPGFADASDGTRRPAIDLSWEPDSEPLLAGYRVYRRELDGTTPEVWRTLGAELVTVPAYRDLSVVAGQRYAYRVTAVSGAGNESGPSAEAVETAPAP
jgi:stage V sporulation protein SpoVS